MLLVKTSIRISRIPGAGLGCFAEEFIPEGTMIWKFHSEIDRVFDSIVFEEPLQSFLTKYCYSHGGKYYLCVDNAKFFNHSKYESNTYESFTEQATFASRDIEQGEEILSDYEKFGFTEDDKNFNLHI